MNFESNYTSRAAECPHSIIPMQSLWRQFYFNYTRPVYYLIANTVEPSGTVHISYFYYHILSKIFARDSRDIKIFYFFATDMQSTLKLTEDNSVVTLGVYTRFSTKVSNFPFWSFLRYIFHSLSNISFMVARDIFHEYESFTTL